MSTKQTIDIYDLSKIGSQDENGEWVPLAEYREYFHDLTKGKAPVSPSRMVETALTKKFARWLVNRHPKTAQSLGLEAPEEDSIGYRLCRVMEDQGITVAKLAKNSGVNSSTIRHLQGIKWDSAAKVMELRALAVALAVDPNWLRHGVAKPRQTPQPKVAAPQRPLPLTDKSKASDMALTLASTIEDMEYTIKVLTEQNALLQKKLDNAFHEQEKKQVSAHTH